MLTESEDAMNMLGAGYEVENIRTDVFGSISGYTPTPDILCSKYGYVTALVWGRMWRYCQGRDGVCRAKIETIAAGLGMSMRTIIRHIEVLCSGGYFLDTTPNLKNRPHIYADTRKLRLAFSTDIVESGVTESHSTMSQSHSRYDRESHEESIKRAIKRDKKKEIGADAPVPDFSEFDILENQDLPLSKEGVELLPKKMPAAPKPAAVKKAKKESALQLKAKDFPGVLIFRRVRSGIYPKTELFEIVDQAVRDVGKRLGRPATDADLTPFYLAWLQADYNANNLAWLTEWAVSGEIRKNGKIQRPGSNSNDSGILPRSIR